MLVLPAAPAATPFLTPTAGSRPARRHYPPRSNGYREHALMAREMYRL